MVKTSCCSKCIDCCNITLSLLIEKVYLVVWKDLLGLLQQKKVTNSVKLIE